MALTVHALTTFATVRDELGLTGTDQQATIERLINAVSEAMEVAAGGRHFDFESGRVEKVRGYGDFRLVLSRPPVISISGIVLLNMDRTLHTGFL